MTLNLKGFFRQFVGDRTDSFRYWGGRFRGRPNHPEKNKVIGCMG